MHSATRRQFLGDIGHGILVAGLGSTLVGQPGAASSALPAGALRLPRDLEALIARMLATPPDELQPWLVGAWKSGMKLETMVTAGALANARTFGGNDYDGYHAFMALSPALAIAGQMPKGQEPLPVLKVLWRNTARIRKAGGGRTALTPVDAAAAREGDEATFRQLVRDGELARAERRLVRVCADDPERAYDELQPLVQDDINVHRIVLAWRSKEMLGIAGKQHAESMLRQILRYCDDEQRYWQKRGHPVPAVRADVARILEQHRLPAAKVGERQPDDAWVEALAQLVFLSDRARAADAVAAALAEGFAPEAVGEAISLAANQLLLHDTGKNRVHGASVGVHASDAANAWRHVARIGPPATRLASLVVGAYHTAGQSGAVGKEPYAFADELAKLESKGSGELLKACAVAIEQRDQRGACAAMQRYGDDGHAAGPAFDLLRRYAVSEDGALHAEKYFHTVHDEFGRTRPALRWRRMVALARVTASEFGEPAPGVAEAKKLLET